VALEFAREELRYNNRISVTRLLFSRSLRSAAVVASLCAVAVPTRCAQTPSVDSRPRNAPGTAAAPAERRKLAGVPNLGKISDVLVRGGQPNGKGFAELKKFGVTTIVNLRQKGPEVEWERQLAESLDLRFINIPVRGWAPPSDAQVALFLKLFQDARSPRVFVHCYYGDDRTGVMVATYRIAQQHWTADQALREMYSFGFHYYLYADMESYVRKFPAHFAAASTFSLFRAAPTPESEAKQPSNRRK
jgi:protein tyrosine/serine phosphatase